VKQLHEGMRLDFDEVLDNAIEVPENQLAMAEQYRRRIMVGPNSG